MDEQHPPPVLTDVLVSLASVSVVDAGDRDATSAPSAGAGTSSIVMAQRATMWDVKELGGV